MPTRVEHHLRAMRLAKDCRDLGARRSTINHVTGLHPRMVQRMLFPDSQEAPRGRAPDSQEWYHGANLLCRAESSIFVSIYRRLRDSGFAAGETLVGAYRHYRSICQCASRISFDRAFDLASHVDGLWLAQAPAFTISTCPDCNSEFVAAIGTVASSSKDCPFCKLVQRYATDRRVQSSFPRRPLGDATAIQIRMMAIVRPGLGQIRGADADRASE
jgi:flagellar transcriptional activator FlhC